MRTEQVRHLIDGERVGDPALERWNPAQPAECVAVTAVGTAADARQAVRAAGDAQPAWAHLSPPERGAVLDRASQLLASRIDAVARDLTREEGKTLAESRGEVQRAVDVLRYYGGEGWRQTGTTIPSSTTNTLIYTKRQPIGVVGIITPWNFPIAIPAWKVAPALVAGNAVVLKPSELTALTTSHLADVLVAAGVPAGVLNVVYGQGTEVGKALVEDECVGAISFTGSMTVGAEILRTATSRGARVQLEMGGKNPIVVTEEADLRLAAQVVATSAFSLTGQACTAASRLIVPSSIADELFEYVAAVVKTYVPGDGLAEGTTMGPVVSAQQLQKNAHYLDVAESEGATLATARPPNDSLLWNPVLVRDVSPDDTVAQDEIFGPVLVMLEVDDFDEAIDIANGVPYGLTAGLCTKSLSKALHFAERIQAGIIKVNRPTVGLDLNVPFGGTKASSTGTLREQGSSATDFYTWEKSVYLGFDTTPKT